MAGQAVFGEAVLKQAKAIAAGAPSETAGRADIIETLVTQHSLLVFRIAYSILRNHHDAEDAAQECFLRVWKAQKRLTQVRNLKTWLARIAWTAALDRRRRTVTAHAGRLPGEELLPRIPDRAARQDEQFAGKQMQELVERLVAGLPEELRQTLELSTVEELNSSEIAEVMNVPEASVRTRLLRARRLLKEKLSAMLEVRKHD
ncbi:MAG TPA: RNA polymerase sigma factor [Candidatus Angelobacter sp.]|nr:RNA polymerase sigma factor [Candidatus Angelobacter sp.]